MKKFLLYLYTLCALIALGVLIYKAAPIFPYINDPEVLISGGVFLLFYYLAYKVSRPKKDRELT